MEVSYQNSSLKSCLETRRKILTSETVTMASISQQKIPMAFKTPQNMLSIQLKFGITQLSSCQFSDKTETEQ